jgi:hypothetical protein
MVSTITGSMKLSQMKISRPEIRARPTFGSAELSAITGGPIFAAATVWAAKPARKFMAAGRAGEVLKKKGGALRHRPFS